MFEIPRSLYNHIIDLLTPLMDILPSRQGWVLPAFQGHPALSEKIDWSGDARSFTVRLVDLCLKYGEIEPGKQALVALLDVIHAGVGHDSQQKIDKLRSQLGEPVLRPAVEPYRGLQSFRVVDAPFFFGRDDMVKRLISKINENGFVTVVGGSGSGKSSLVCAGFVAQMQDARWPWQIAIMRPLTNPLFELAKVLYRPLKPDLAPDEEPQFFGVKAKQLLQGTLSVPSVISTLRSQYDPIPYFLLVVDQFEEIFDPRIDEQSRQCFIDALLAAHKTGIYKIMLVLRSDFLGALPKYRQLDELAGATLVYITPMNAAEHQAAIEEPALRTGRRFEAGLVNRIVVDLENAPGDLPLLQFALTELWKRQSPDGVLTHAAYDAIEGVSGAIAQHAQQVYQKLNAVQQEQTRILFERRLVKIPELGKTLDHATRRRIKLNDLDVTTQELITTTLTAQGLLVTDRDETTGERTVEIVHEALIQHWDELQEWLSQNQENLRTHQALTEAAEIWERFHRKPALLYRGEQLRAAQQWKAGHVDELLEKERNFLQTSRRWLWYRRAGVGSLIILVGLFSLLVLLPESPLRQLLSSGGPPIPMPANDYNIAVATFGVQDLNLVNEQAIVQELERDSKRFSIEIANFLADHEAILEQELDGRHVNILEPQRFELIGVTVADLAEKAKELQADIIVYGNLSRISTRRWQVAPRYYVADRTVLDRASETIDQTLLSKPISYIPGNDEDISNVLQQLLPRLDTLLVLSRGLPSYDLGHEAGYEKASQIFCAAANAEGQLNNHDGTELLYFFCGKAKEQLAWIRRNGTGWEPTLLHDTFTAYKAGLALNPDYLRIQINLAALLVQVYRPTMLDCSIGNETKLTEAKEMFEAAISQINVDTVPDGTKAVAFLHLGHAYFWIGRCYGDLSTDWTTATTHYEQVIRMQDISKVRADLIDYSVAVAYAQKGIMALWVYGVNQAQAEDTLLANSIADFEKAITLLFAMQDDNYVADYTKEMMPYALMAFCVGKQTHLAEQYLTELADLLPGFDRTKILSTMNPTLRKDCGL